MNDQIPPETIFDIRFCRSELASAQSALSASEKRVKELEAALQRCVDVLPQLLPGVEHPAKEDARKLLEAPHEP